MITEEQIQELQSTIRVKIINLNSGGCVHFAYYFSKRLKELKIDHSITLVNESYDDPISITYKGFQPVMHILVHIPEIGYIDGYSTYNILSKGSFLNGSRSRVFYKKISKISVKKLDYFRQTGAWNPIYNVNQNKSLESIINSIIV